MQLSRFFAHWPSRRAVGTPATKRAQLGHQGRIRHRDYPIFGWPSACCRHRESSPELLISTRHAIFAAFAFGVSNPARARSGFPDGPHFRALEKRCAAQAEYGRLAAQAYSPSDAMSQAKLGLDGMKKVQRAETKTNSRVETGLCGGRICWRGRGGPPDFPRRRRPRRVAPCGGVVRPARPIAAGCDVATAAPAGGGRRLFLACGIRLPRRGSGAATARPAGPAAASVRAPGCG